MSLEEAEKSVVCLPETNKTFLLDIDPKKILSHRKDSLHRHSLDLDWQIEKRKRYLNLANKYKSRILVIDADQEEREITKLIVSSITNELRYLGIIVS